MDPQAPSSLDKQPVAPARRVPARASPPGRRSTSSALVEQAPGHPAQRRGRGACSNPAPRFEPDVRLPIHDGWALDEDLPSLKTSVSEEQARSLITRNESPDISFDRSINPYRGCEHGCVYCFARPTHAYLGLSPGLDFESRLFVKSNAPELLVRELSKPGYEVKTLALGAATDPYQPIERHHQVTRRLLEVLDRAGHPVGIVTKSSLVTRDLDLLSRMAERNLVKVAISVTTLDGKRARTMEPRATGPSRRLEAIKRLSAAGIPTMVMVAPIIPALNDHEIEDILEAAYQAGAREAGWVLLRLPLEVRDLVAQWLMEHEPGRYRHVMALIRSMRGGRDYDARFTKRMTGEGPYAWMIGRRFRVAMRRLGYRATRLALETKHFVPPCPTTRQLNFFDGLSA